MFDTRQTTEEGNVGTDSLNGLFVAFDEKRHANGRSKLHFSAEIANGVNHLLDERGLGSGFFVELSRVKLRVRGDHDARFFVFAAHAGRHRHLLPKFFGDERNDRVSQTQNAFEHHGQSMTRGACRGLVAAVDLNLGKFQIPVAELVPDEAVNGVGDVVETVLGKALVHRIDRAVVFVENPAVDDRKIHWLAGVGTQTAVLAFNVHQHEARGVPELVAEIAVAFAAFDVEVDVAAERGVGGHRKAQCVGAVRGDAVGIVLACLGFHQRGLFGLTQTASVLCHE